ncbi:hypothetical protein DWV00_14195 [Trinickia dinghuensis]|uniref:Uncharacterized protein n=1 Tax=Trinickia dinghuensis TaxID=2291023 RepID=A0A3D8K0K2_9BURK|nr:hypothetical protein DWV00_14195 [Trinickia dinghuensis]
MLLRRWSYARLRRRHRRHSSRSAILGANGTAAVHFDALRQETLIALRNFAIVADAAPLHHGRTSRPAARPSHPASSQETPLCLRASRRAQAPV